MSMYVEILKRMVANQNQEHTNRIIHHDQVGFIHGMQGWFIPANQEM